MSLSLELVCPSMGGHEAAVETWRDTMSKPWDVRVYDDTTSDAAGFLSKCEIARQKSDAAIIGYLHSDLYIHEYDWDRRVLAEFTKPDVAVVGFVGATRLGHQDIYKTPYDYRQLARGDVWSNLTDWSSHGRQETGSRRVAVIDSCAVFVRRDFLNRVGGWPVGRYPNSSHCSDLWICCVAHRLDLHVRMVGVSCSHRSGGKGASGAAWLDARGGDTALHRQAHELIYEDFRDVLPIRVEEPWRTCSGR